MSSASEWSMRFRRWDVRNRDGFLTDECGRLGLFWFKRSAFMRAAWINDMSALHEVRVRCYIVDRRTGARYTAK